MQSLIRVQKDINKTLKRAYTNFKKTPKDRISESYLETRLEQLEKQWSTFEETHKNLIGNYGEEDYDESEYNLKDLYGETEDLYSEYKIDIKEKLTKFKNSFLVTSDLVSNNYSEVKLPKITIPIFSGHYSQWNTFRDLFQSLIHSNKSLQAVQKLHYLKSYLTGEAEQLLRHLPVTSENYELCWGMLEQRFNNKKFITNSILKRFFSQKNIVSESSNAVKELLDTTNECLNALKNIGIVTDNWDVIVLYILSSKLDNKSRELWETKICNLTDELPTLNQFLEFLEHRFRSLEFLTNKPVKSTQSHHVTFNEKSNCVFCSDSTHKIGNCKKFAKGNLKTRREFVQSSALCFNCLGANHSVVACRLPTRCKICKRKHHSLLHCNASVSTDNVSANNQSPEDINVVAMATTSKPDETNIENITTCFSNTRNQVLLATALVRARNNSGSSMTLRALLDQGSQASFITESAVQLLGLKKIKSNSVISGVGGDGNAPLDSKYVVQINLQSIQDESFTICVKAHVLKKLTSFLPVKEFVVHLWPNLPRMKLADPNFNKPSKIDMLLGADVYCQIIAEGLMRGPPGTPIAQNTKLGWILSGKIENDHHDQHGLGCENILTMYTQINNDDFNLKQFWELESDSFNLKRTHLTPEEQRCEDIYKETTTRDLSGSYVVKLPFRDVDPSCKYGNSREVAIKRFLMLEKRLLNSLDLKKSYTEVISEYLKLGHMELVPTEEIYKKETVYLPHHAVVRADKSTTKIRVVFDASCRDQNGVSLNSDLMVGPSLQPDLRHIVLRWRLHPICLVADIIKMYRQVKVTREDVDYQRLVWRTDPTEDLQHFRLLRVTFGTASAPYLAVRTLQQVAHDEGGEYPAASEKILKDFYMDDLLTGCESVSEGKQLFNDITHLLNAGGFELQKWSSNDENLLKEIDKEDLDLDINVELKSNEIVKILGLTWNRRTDEFEYSVQLPPISIPVTKRKVISDIARLYDPLGWIAPAIVKAKILIQKLWLSGIGWDQELPNNLLDYWTTYRVELLELTKFRLPRWISTKVDVTLELHGFSDASNEAYAAVIYARVVDGSGNVHVHLITSKTKVAPIKQVCIPRLELCGAVLLAKLLQEVAEVLHVPKDKLHAWTDSTVVLAWLSSHPSRWKTFIANRVSEILDILDASQWSHVSSADNPADCASRGVTPSALLNMEMWRTGSPWLQNKVINYERKPILDTNLEEKGTKVYHIVEEIELKLWTKYSSLRKLLRVLAYCNRFIKKLRKLRNEYPTWLTSRELNQALLTCIKQCQRKYFSQEISDLKLKGTVNKKSKLTTLNPFLDKDDILRVGGRLDRANISDNLKHPLIMPSKSHLTNLIIMEAHERTLHGGPQLTLNYLRSKYWVIDAKNRTKMFVRNCVTCARHAAQTRTQLMGQLPPVRVTPIRAFYQSGVDYAGPIQIRTTKGRGHRAHKGYICLFICMATKAIHLEAVSDLTSQGFLAAFKRFVARRGHCAELFSDNGTNFVGAARELKFLFAADTSNLTMEIVKSLADNGTEWHFIPPHAPHFGGLWESGIRATKHHLRRVIGSATLTYEEITTLLHQIEACLNSRPLSQLSSDPQDPTPLTPGHFLVGEPLLLVPDKNYENSSISNLNRWQIIQKMLQVFWRRWSHEYLTQFLHRYKWANVTPEPKIGDVALIKEDDMPPARWLLGVITEKHTGLDGLTRVVSLKVRNVIIKRPINKICILPVTV
ncbi:uncharacterized protein LOC123690703 [Pieris rapae]|uniref:uncharacterized protein LOC123690703 n=1 Tax=Pieris rapae TaxID=64459 RepID=UPI001E27E96B|nr:uncharacterized protein LOC123690703 [Pieris rapae]